MTAGDDLSAAVLWDRWLDSTARDVMARLQASLRFCEVLGEGDPDFVRALRRVGADVAWAFHERGHHVGETMWPA